MKHQNIWKKYRYYRRRRTARCICNVNVLPEQTGGNIAAKSTNSSFMDLFKIRAFKWSNLVRKARGCRVTLFSLLWAGTFLSKKKKKKKKNNNNPTCRDRCTQSLVRESCSRNNVVEPVGKTSLVLDTVFGHELEKEYTELRKDKFGIGPVTQTPSQPVTF